MALGYDLQDFCQPFWIHGQQVNVEIDIVAQTIPLLNVNIAAVAIPAINVDIVAQSVGNITIDIAAQSMVGNLRIDITAVSFVGNFNINIAAQTLPTVAINISAQTLPTVAINIAAQTLPTVAVDITAQSVGNIAIDIAAQTVGNIAINIAAQVAPVNINTFGGANIVIDVLTQAAYLERRSTLSNNGVVALWTNATGNVRDGKFFPRGCRGFIDDIEMSCRDLTGVGGTITVYIAPYPGAGYLYTRNIVVAPPGAAAWRAASFNVMWNYDSLFIFWVCSTAVVDYAYDAGTPYDQTWSNDAGATWTPANNRMWVRVIMTAETAGDLPVSGTVNTVEIPMLSTSSYSGIIGCPNNAETSVLTVLGYGITRRVVLKQTHDDVEWRFFVDGTIVDRYALLGWVVFTPDNVRLHDYLMASEQIQLLEFTDGDICVVCVTLPFKFKRSFEVRCRNDTGAGQNAQVGIVADLLT